MKRRIAACGAVGLAHAIRQRLEQDRYAVELWEVARGAMLDADIVVATLGELAAGQVASRPALLVLLAGHRLYLAPAGAACSRCLCHAVASDTARDTPLATPDITGLHGVRATAVPLAASWAAQLASRLCDPSAQDTRSLPVHVIDGLASTLSVEHLLPRSGCPVCEAAPDPAQSDQRAAAGPLRGESIDELAQRVSHRCFGDRLGLLAPPLPDLQMPIGAATLWLRIPGLEPIATLGRSRRYEHARAVAALEALERYAGIHSGFARESRYATFAEMGKTAIDPMRLGLHPPQSHAKAGFPYRPYAPDMPLHWQHARDLATGRTHWLPECVTFYGRRGDRPQIVFDSSNGCALGACLEEAALHGLLELVERDALLLAWYQRRALPDITAALKAHPGFRQLHRKLGFTLALDIRVYDSTAEHGIPSVIAVGCSRSGGAPATVVSAGAAFSAVDAATSALHELSGHCLFLQEAFSRPEVHQRALSMLGDAEQVRTMEDHGIVNALPQARERFVFLLESGLVGGSLPAAVPLQPDVAANLQALVTRLQGHGFQVLMVDHTVPPVRALGLQACKMIVPGLLPITFGHANRRTQLPRLQDAMPGELNLLPHPFM